MYFRNDPVGCTATILYQMYGEHGLRPSRQIAGLLLSAILSDTLVFRSPTSTPLDQHIAEKALARMAGEEIQSYAEQMFEAGADLTGRTRRMCQLGLQGVSRGDVKFGVGQPHPPPPPA